MSAAARGRAAFTLPPALAELERAADEAIAALEAWRARALEAEHEIESLRSALEESAATLEPGTDARDQLKRLRAQNAALRARLSQARRRVSTLLAWTDSLNPGP